MPREDKALDILLRLCAASLLATAIGFERRVHRSAIGLADASGRGPRC